MNEAVEDRFKYPLHGVILPLVNRETRWPFPEPSLEDAWRIVLAARHPVRKTRHSIAVALAALRLGAAMRKSGQNADVFLGAFAGLLHDIAHGRHEHAVAGAALLARQGWNKAAFVVSCHTALSPLVLDRMGIAERDSDYKLSALPRIPDADMPSVALASVCVYLADKYCFGDHAVSIAERFDNIRTHCRRHGITEGIDQRQRIAMAVENRVEKICGANPLNIISSPIEHPLEARLHDMLRSLKYTLANVPSYTPKLHTQKFLIK